MGGIPDFPLGAIFDVKFTTRQFSDAVPTTLIGTPVVEVYEDNSLAQITDGETLTVDFDGRAGFHNLNIVASGANGYESGKSYAAVLTAGTVGGTLIAGETIVNFTIERSPALRPTVAGRTVDVAAGGEVGLDYGNTLGTIGNADVDWVDASNQVDVGNILGTPPSLTGGDLDVNVIGGVAPLGTAMRGTDGVDTAPMRGTDGVDTAPMRGTDAGLLAASAPTNFGDLAITVGDGRVDIGNILGIPPSLTGGDLDVNVTTLAAAALTAIEDEVLDAIITGALHNVGNSLARRIRELAESGTYAGGRVWVDTIGGTAGTEKFVNGAEVLPSLTLADANTLAADVGLSRFAIAPTSALTFVAAQNNQAFDGVNWTLALGGVSISGSHVMGADVTGIATGANEAHFEHCNMGNCTLARAHLDFCDIEGTITLSAATTYKIIDCVHAGAAVIDYGLAVGSTTVHLHRYGGSITISNLGQLGTDVLHFDSPGGKLTLDASCVGGTVNINGVFELVDNSSGVTINRGGDVIADTVNIQSRLPSALVGGRMRSNMEAIAGVVSAATQLSLSADTIFGLGTASGTPTLTTMISDIAFDDNAQLKGRNIIFAKDTATVGLRGQATDITGGTAATNELTFTAVTSVPVSGDTFVIV